MSAALVESVRTFLRGAHSKVTAKFIADEIEASPIEVGKALDELKGLHHADRDAMNRWHLTEKGRLNTPADPPVATNKRIVMREDRGKTYIERIVEAIGNDALTAPEIAARTNLAKEIVAQNLSASGKKHGLMADGKRGNYHLWRRADRQPPPDVDRAAIAAGQDKEEAERRPNPYEMLAADMKQTDYRSARAQLPEKIKAAMDNRPPPNAQDLIADVCDEIKALLLEKNRRYGNSALQPMRVFSKADPIEQINVRLDDKLSRVLAAQADDEEDAEFDLLGYLVLKRVAKRLPR